MNEETPTGVIEPFHRCRIAAAVLSLLTAALVFAVAMDMVRRPTTRDRITTIRRITAALPVPAADTAGADTRYGPMVPMALYDTDGAVARGQWESRP